MQFHDVFNSRSFYSHWLTNYKTYKMSILRWFSHTNMVLLCGRERGPCVKCSWCLVDRFVEQLSTEESALQLLPQQAALPLRTLHEAAVLLRSARQVRDDLVHRAVRHILIHRESRLTCSQKHKHVNTIRIKTCAPSHAALLSTHPTGSWSDHTFPAAGQSKPYSPWERDSSRSFCAEEHTLVIIHLWSCWMCFTRLDSLFQREFDRVLVVRRHHDVCHPVVVDLLQNVLQTPYRQRSGLMKASRNPSMTETDE